MITQSVDEADIIRSRKFSETISEPNSLVEGYPCYIIDFDVNYFANMFGSREDVIKDFSQGSHFSVFAEQYSDLLYESDEKYNRNHPCHDARKGDDSISVKQFTKSGLELSYSRDLGVGRSKSFDKKMAAIKESDVHIIVDIAIFPVVSFTPISNFTLESMMREGVITVDKIKPSERFDFYAHVSKDYKTLKYGIFKVQNGKIVHTGKCKSGVPSVQNPNQRHPTEIFYK